MVAAIEQRHLDIDDRISGQRSVFRRFADAFLNSRDVFPRNRTALDCIHEFETRAGLLRIELDPDVAVLAAATGLAHKSSLLLDAFANRLLVSDLRLSDICA